MLALEGQLADLRERVEALTEELAEHRRYPVKLNQTVVVYDDRSS